MEVRMKRLLIDLESAPHIAMIWGPKNSYIQPKNVIQSGYTMCFAAKWLGERGLTFKSVHKDGAEDMTQTAWNMLHEADAVIHYNGKKFDIPILNADFAEHGLTPPSDFVEIDLLTTVRGKFRRYSNKLDEIARWLGVGCKVQHKGLDLWRECMDGDETAWRTMERYNRQDVVLLEKVYKKLLPWIKNHPALGMYVDDDRPVCPHCASRNITKHGTRRTKTQCYQRYVCNDCGTWMRERLNSTPTSKKNVLVPV